MSNYELTSSLENYLEAIYTIIEDKNFVKPRDIALRLNVSQASVTGALRSLSEKGLISYMPYTPILFTTKGENIAKDVYKRHKLLRDFFMKVLLLDYKISDEVACKLEHEIPKIVVDRLAEFIEYIEKCPNTSIKWEKKSGYKCFDQASRCDECNIQAVKQGE